MPVRAPQSQKPYNSTTNMVKPYLSTQPFLFVQRGRAGCLNKVKVNPTYRVYRLSLVNVTHLWD